MTSYPLDNVLTVLSLDRLYDEDRIIYLENFADKELTNDNRLELAENLRICISVPRRLSESQKQLLLAPYVSKLALFPSAPFEEICSLLDRCPTILDIIKLFYDKELSTKLHLEHYEAFTDDAGERLRLLSLVLGKLDSRTSSAFLNLWHLSDCSMYELKRLEEQMRCLPDNDWESVLSNHSGYVNLLYGVKFKKIDLSDVMGYQEEILIYAITRNKKSFIRLVDENADLFLSLGKDSLLFDSKLYEEHFNLNELTQKSLSECAWMKTGKLYSGNLSPGRLYTFPELKALYGLDAEYVLLYNSLASDSQDYRLKVLSQLAKRKVINRSMHADEIVTLAGRLDQKTLYDWQGQEFGHITGLSAADVTQLLIHFDALSHLLPSARDKTDVRLILRNLNSLGRFETVKAMMESLVDVDQDWAHVLDKMELNEEFQTRYRDNIVKFLCNGGANLVRTYYGCLDDTQEAAFLRVVKAELMGEFGTLKYYEGDLQRELDFSVGERIINGWTKNLRVEEGDIIAEECDDFFSTMLLGVQPMRTCLSYIDGEHRDCLLSSFDSNKKVLYATIGDKVVSRAFIRLTKGRLTESDACPEKDNGFTFVDVENLRENKPEIKKSQEFLTLFLEHQYIAGVSPGTASQITRMFISLVKKKADELGAMLVLSNGYKEQGAKGFTQTRFNIYISKTKAGAQYLDSLSGKASVSSEGSYKSNIFLVRESAEAGTWQKACGE